MNRGFFIERRKYTAAEKRERERIAKILADEKADDEVKDEIIRKEAEKVREMLGFPPKHLRNLD